MTTKRLIRIFLAASTLLLQASAASAQSATPWLTVNEMNAFVAANLARGSTHYPTKIECRLRDDGWILVRFRVAPRGGGAPFFRWQFAVTKNPKVALKKISSDYRIVNQVNLPGPNDCALAYRGNGPSG